MGGLKTHHGGRLRVECRIHGSESAVARVRVQWRAILIHGLIPSILVHKRGRRIGGLLGSSLDEWVELLEMMRRHTLVLVELAEVHHGRTGMHGTLARGHGQRRAQSHAEAQRGRVQVTGLRVVNGIGAAGRGRVIARRLVGEGREGEGVGIE